MLLARQPFWYALLLIFCATALSNWANADNPEPGLFGYFQQANDDILAFPQMASAVQRYRATLRRQQRCASYNTKNCQSNTWPNLLQQWQAYRGQELLEQLNTAINKLNYRTDKNNYAREDYWATPHELIKNGGDCEDFALAKMLALKHLGMPARSMRIVVLQDTATAQAHAVLAVSTGQKTIILDNKTDALLLDNELPHYAPLYSINERQWWLHMPLEVANRLFVQTASTTGSSKPIGGAIVSR